MKVRLTENGLKHYTERTAERRLWRSGTVIGTLPSGDVVVDWPWGLAFHRPDELREVPR